MTPVARVPYEATMDTYVCSVEQSPSDHRASLSNPWNHGKRRRRPLTPTSKTLQRSPRTPSQVTASLLSA